MVRCVALLQVRQHMAIHGLLMPTAIYTHYTYCVLTSYLTLFQNKSAGISLGFSSR